MENRARRIPLLVAAVLLAACELPAQTPAPAALRIHRLDTRFDSVVAPDARIETCAGGFSWVEGPVWDRASRRLLFSDIPRNVVRSWSGSEGSGVFLERSGWTGEGVFAGREPGSNGLAFDAEGRLLLCRHGDRRVVRREADGTFTTLAENFEGRRLNSPNDLVVTRDGGICFTDPPFGLPRGFEDPGRELEFCGVYRRKAGGALVLLTKAVKAPNGLAFSPAEDVLYVSNADAGRPVVLAFPVRDGGSALGEPRVFFDAAPHATKSQAVPDGLKTDSAGRLFVCGPGGVHVLLPDGTRIGFLETGAPAANCAFGGDGSTLFIAADTSILRLETLTRGSGSRT